MVSVSRCYRGPLETADDPGDVVAMETLPVWKARLHLIVALTLTREVEEIHQTVKGSKYGTAAAVPSAL